MTALLWAAGGTGFTFLMTSLGAAMVFLFRKQVNALAQRIFLGFAAGVMIAASVWSLLIPAIEEAEAAGMIGWIPAAGGFVLGVALMIAMDGLLPHLHPGAREPEGVKAPLKRTTLLVFAVTLHNIPEGMAVALPLRQEGMSPVKSFLCGSLSGFVEPVFGILTVLLAGQIAPLMPWLLSFAAGAMIYVVVEELIPEAHLGEHSNVGTLGVMGGFLIMMILGSTPTWVPWELWAASSS